MSTVNPSDAVLLWAAERLRDANPGATFDPDFITVTSEVFAPYACPCDKTTPYCVGCAHETGYSRNHLVVSAHFAERDGDVTRQVNPVSIPFEGFNLETLITDVVTAAGGTVTT